MKNINNPKIIILLISILTALIIFFIAFKFSKPGLILSVSIRLLSASVALYLILKFNEWRILFLMVMFILMATRQILTLLIWSGLVETSPVTRMISEIPGYAVTIISLIAIIYVGMILSGQRKLIMEQKKSLDTLGGLLPICAHCKKVRDDKGYWEQIESYIENHSQAQFSHSLCEECGENLYGDQEWFKNIKK